MARVDTSHHNATTRVVQKKNGQSQKLTKKMVSHTSTVTKIIRIATAEIIKTLTTIILITPKITMALTMETKKMDGPVCTSH